MWLVGHTSRTLALGHSLANPYPCIGHRSNLDCFFIAHELRMVSHFKRVVKRIKQNNKNKEYGTRTAKPKDIQCLTFYR